MDDFWDRVMECDHKDLYPDYCHLFTCSTPYCHGYEVHCRDCKVYIADCGCMVNSGMSGWSWLRRNSYERNK